MRLNNTVSTNLLLLLVSNKFKDLQKEALSCVTLSLHALAAYTKMLDADARKGIDQYHITR